MNILLASDKTIDKGRNILLMGF